jgi:2-(1,2-epoxy-1,2-dihydrophenyl)acetyl-CoA isomerase
MAKVKYEQDGALAVITMNDPETLNAVDSEMVAGLTEAFDRAAREARAAVLTGAGRGFSSGANLSGGGGLPPTDASGKVDLGLSLEKMHNPFVSKLRDLPIPWVSAVNGAAAGVGCSYALLADIIVAGESGYFLQAFRRIALVPDGGSTYILPRMLTRAQAMEMMLLGEKLPAAKALEWGLINRVAPDADLLTTAKGIGQELANGPTRALSLIRKLGWASLDATWAEQLHNEREAQRETGRSEDFTEGVSAFFAKRKAQFKGT